MSIDLVDIGAVAVVVMPLIVLLVWLFADGTELEIHAPSRVLDWPRGVQEEEPIRWQVERLRRPGSKAQSPASQREATGRERARAGL
jgi:hypothetical protein